MPPKFDGPPGLPTYTMVIHGGIICCTDLNKGTTITNGAEAVLNDLKQHFKRQIPTHDFARMRIIYRDTTDTWDGIAHRDGLFIRFVPLRTKDFQRAISLASVGIDRCGRDWPA